MDQQRVTDRGVSGEASGWCAPTLRCTAHCPLARLGSRHANKLDQEVCWAGVLGASRPAAVAWDFGSRDAKVPRRGALEERARAPLACWFQEIVGHGGMPIQRHESPTQGASPPSPFQLMLASTSIPLRACFESRWAAVLGSVHGRMHSGRTSESCSHQQRQAMGGPACRPGCRSGASMRGLRPTLACSSHAHDTKRQLAREVLRHRASGPPLRPAERGKASLGPGLHGRALSLGGDVFVGRSHSQLARGLMGAGNPRFCTQSGSTM